MKYVKGLLRVMLFGGVMGLAAGSGALTARAAAPDPGTLVAFGSYEQDNDTSNGKERIKWIVLDKRGEQLLLLSTQVLDFRQYKESLADVTWADASLREWLNSAFIDDSFSEPEQAVLMTVELQNNDNAEYGTDGGEDTQDRVFLFSEADVEKYLAGTEWSSILQATATEYAALQGGLTGQEQYSWWLLRTPGAKSTMVEYVGNSGTIDTMGSSVSGISAGIRPAVWVDLAPKSSKETRTETAEKPETEEPETEVQETEVTTEAPETEEPVTEAAETEAITEAITEAAETEAITEPVTEAAETEAITEPVTEAAETEAITEPVTEAAETEAITETITEAAETEVTETAETEAVTEAPETEVPETEAITEEAETEVSGEQELFLPALAEVGDVVYMGQFEQDNDSSDGEEPIAWTVLAREDGCVLLLSSVSLTAMGYHAFPEAVTWEKSTSRIWLNSIFRSEAFSVTELSHFVTYKHADDAEQEEYVEDQIFLLSIQEAEKYFAADADRVARSSEYAAEQGAYVSAANQGAVWWLRTPGEAEGTAAGVLSNGMILAKGVNVASTDGSIRPAVWVR